MSRSRVKNVAYDDDYDDYDDYASSPASYGSSNFGSYGTSPSVERFMYNRNGDGGGTNSFAGYFEKEQSPGGQQSSPGSNQEPPMEPVREEFSLDDKGAPPGDEGILGECACKVRDVLGFDHSDAQVVAAVRKSNYNVENAVTALLETAPAPAPPTPTPALSRPPGLPGSDAGPEASQFSRVLSFEKTPTGNDAPGQQHPIFSASKAGGGAESTSFASFGMGSPGQKTPQRAPGGSPTAHLQRTPSTMIIGHEGSVSVESGIAASVVAAAQSTETTPRPSPETSAKKDRNAEKAPSPIPTATPNKPQGPQRSAASTVKLIQEVEDAANQTKKRISLVVIGHVDAGKSTLMGHLLYLNGGVNQRTMRKFEKESKEQGKGSFAFAWVLDEHAEERERGITMDVGVSNFSTEHRRVTLLDAPGHKDFVPNMISGASQADTAVLVVDANPGEFESGFQSGGQTKEHTMLIRSLGITQLAVAVNKLDAVDWSEERFQEIIEMLSPFLKQTGFKDKNTTFVPVAGLTGENIVERKEPRLEAWYKGPTLMQVIDQFEPAVRPIDRPFRLIISDKWKSQQLGLTIGGKIEAGLLCVGDKLAVLPGTDVCNVKGVQSECESVKVAKAGENVDVGLTGVDHQMISIGQVLCDPERPVPVVSRFEAQVVTFNLTVPVTKGKQVILHMQCTNEPATVTKLVSLLDKNSGEVTKKKPRCLTRHSTAVVEVTTQRPICLELYANCKQLGRFTMRDEGMSLGAGIVTKLGV